jgi:hypothetical protein
MTETRKMDVQALVDGFESLPDSIAQGFSCFVIAGREPLVFQLAPQRFHDVEVWRILRQVKEKQDALLPRLNPLFDTSSPMHRCIV